MNAAARQPANDDQLRAALIAGDRAALARAITLIESKRGDHRARAQALLQSLLPLTGGAMRVGLTGVPGVGKSTTIDALGSLLTSQGRKVAVLAVDPSSSRTGGSILGDKTRMARLAIDRGAFIRPSPAAGTLGGVASRTRETMLLCEAAGFDVVIIETVGIGQSETTVADMTDFFLVLMLPGAGDELQGIKKGVLEIADLIAVNKADGDNLPRARAASSEYSAAMHILAPESSLWTPPVMLISAANETGLDEMWAHVMDYRARMTASGDISRKRSAQEVRWMWALVEERLRAKLAHDPALKARIPAIERAVSKMELSAPMAADQIAALAGL
ncbi:methylmalonyl Co-A mutase-associated GTPase MeaB [Terrarubrum flagellatum]|uniref:methylmalonyl Co-A mutase-associated GTPase MeaB n=1 Tax=Terrirubrum flagellatum TaxID=2895980 RepID=UPI003144F1CC